MRSRMTSLTLVRHGTTEWMEQNRLHGALDSPLSQRGRWEAQCAAAHLAGRKIDYFYTSPIGRARQTAEILSTTVGLEPVLLEGLQELNFGWFEGGKVIDFNRAGLKGRLLEAWFHAVLRLSGEPRSWFDRRVGSTLRFLLEKHPGERVLLVTHSAVHETLMAQLLNGGTARPSRIEWAPCGITEVEITADGRVNLIGMNQQEHLHELRSTM